MSQVQRLTHPLLGYSIMQMPKVLMPRCLQNFVDSPPKVAPDVLRVQGLDDVHPCVTTMWAQVVVQPNARTMPVSTVGAGEPSHGVLLGGVQGTLVACRISAAGWVGSDGIDCIAASPGQAISMKAIVLMIIRIILLMGLVITPPTCYLQVRL